MKTLYKYYKNSNTNDLVMSQEFTETRIKQPILFYRDKKSIDYPNLLGYVQLSKRKFERYTRKYKKH
tara:strand:+ start:818 stop:1018 length:201 start_codon:yes stop_codon:yes gene_type:complete